VEDEKEQKKFIPSVAKYVAIMDSYVSDCSVDIANLVLFPKGVLSLRRGAVLPLLNNSLIFECSWSPSVAQGICVACMYQKIGNLFDSYSSLNKIPIPLCAK
jgi:hypothetical protein